MKTKKWNDQWKFWEDKDSFALVWNIPEQAREITLPHDAMIESPAYKESPNKGNTGFRDGGIYTYVKNLHVEKEAENQTLMLKFEGVYMNAMVYVNGQMAGKNMFGYSTFYVPLNDFVTYGADNEIRVQVRNSGMTNSRWYSGSGIYRDVYLLEAGLTHFVPEGIQITCESADEKYAVLHISSELKNEKHASSAFILESIIRDESGIVCAKECTRLKLHGKEERTVFQRIYVEKPKLWSDESPSLYTCESILKDREEILDCQKDIFGIRTLTLDAKRGLQVNGKSVKLRGACVHHDCGLLGAATYEEFHIRQMKKLKEAGFNAVRSSHQPMAPAMLRACDKLGIYVMDELSDMWDRCKSDLDYGLYFREWWEKDLTAMVRKDYNHPSVVLYSIGNEIPEIGTDSGAKTAQELAGKIKSLDRTRFTTAGINGVFAAGDRMGEIMADLSRQMNARGEVSGNVNDFMTVMDSHMDEIVVHRAISERLEMACAALDVAGYNYMTARYEPDHETYPNRVIVGSETYPPEIARNWGIIKNSEHVIGDFTWTGWDYIGEAGVGVPAYQWGEGGFSAQFPVQLAYCGDIDITGFRRPASYFRECVFGLRSKPYIAVQDPNRYGQELIKTPWVISDTVSSWTWEGCEGKSVIVEVYAPDEEVELLVNGKSVGKKKSGESEGFRTLFETVYEPGVVEAVLYKEGTEIERTKLCTAKEDRRLVLSREEEYGEELAFVNVELQDSEGTIVTDKDCRLKAEVSGGAVLSGFGSGSPKPSCNYTEESTELWNGRALMILKKMDCDKIIRIKVTSEDGMCVESELD